MSVKVKLFLILLTAGLAGILSFLLVDLEALLSIMPLPPGTEVQMSIPALKALSLVQPAFLVAIAVTIGVGLASKIGLSSPVAEALAGRGDVGSALRTQIFSGIIGGLTGSIALISIAAATKLFLSPEVLARLREFGNILPLPTRLLYGGIVEELLVRWGLMTLFVWAAWRLSQKGLHRPTRAVFVGAILVSSLVFAIGHFPIAFILFPDPTPAIIMFVVFGNSTFGLIGGYLYWKKGLESAMIAHAFTHVGIFTASYFGAYF